MLTILLFNRFGQRHVVVETVHTVGRSEFQCVHGEYHTTRGRHGQQAKSRPLQHQKFCKYPVHNVCTVCSKRPKFLNALKNKQKCHCNNDTKGGKQLKMQIINWTIRYNTYQKSTKASNLCENNFSSHNITLLNN